MTRSLVSLSALALLTACSTERPTDVQDLQVLDGSGVDKEAVIYYGSAPDAPEHDAVVSLHQLTSDGTSVYVSPFCTGTLIRDDVVLTAAHCLDTAGGGPRYRTLPASELAIYVGDDPSADILDHLYLASEAEIKSDYDRRRLRNDIALVRLSTPITEAVTPVAELPSTEGFSSSDLGETLNFSGFGETETGSSGVKLQVDGTLGCSGSGCPHSGVGSTTIAYNQPDGGPCFGDSGGPAFVTRSSIAYVAGITSYGDSYCTTYGVSTRVDAYETWIADWAGAADTGSGDGGSSDGGSSDGGSSDGGTSDGGSSDGGTSDGGTSDGGAATCGDGTCDAGESCDGRDGTVDCPDDCPGKTTGKPSNRYCYVGDTCEGGGC